MQEIERELPIELEMINIDNTSNHVRIRSNITHTLLAYACDQGILLREPRTKLQHILTWSKIQDMIPIVE